MNDESPVFWVNNKHSTKVGQPPQIDGNSPRHYHGYFENEYGDQFIFDYDFESETGILWAGDAGWEKPYNVIDGLAPELMLSEAEETWLQVCWNAATAFEQNRGE